MTDYVQWPGSQQPMEPERGRTRFEGRCPRCGQYIVVYTPQPGLPNWHATIHDATPAELRRQQNRGERS